jgi:Tfp pilus assembly protein FimV
MFPKGLALLVVAAFVFLNFSTPRPTSGQIPSPQALENERQLRTLTQPGEATPGKAPVGAAAQFIATTTQRIDRDRAEVRVYRNNQPVELFPSFHELVTASPADHQMRLDRLVGKSVALVPSEKRADHWDIFAGVGGVGDLILAGNIFKVRQVLLSSRKNPIEVRVDGQIHRLKPGQALLVL